MDIYITPAILFSCRSLGKESKGVGRKPVRGWEARGQSDGQNAHKPCVLGAASFLPLYSDCISYVLLFVAIPFRE